MDREIRKWGFQGFGHDCSRGRSCRTLCSSVYCNSLQLLRQNV